MHVHFSRNDQNFTCGDIKKKTHQQHGFTWKILGNIGSDEQIMV